jgi:hypothetical protein
MSKKNQCYNKLIMALERETQMKYPECLNYCVYTLGNYKIEAGNCICDVDIIYNYIVVFKGNKTFVLGSTCIKNFEDDQLNITHPDIYNHWKIQTDNMLLDVEKNKHRFHKCIKCKTPWTHNRCLNKGLCVNCRKERNELKRELSKSKEIIKYNNKEVELNFIFKYLDNPSGYLKSKLKKPEIFKEYLTYFL